MRLFTKLFLSAALALPSLLASAATITVEVGDNFYRGPSGSETITMAPSDVLVFQYVGQGSHPTQSDSSPRAWTTFQMNAGSTTRTFAANTFAPGTYPFHCTAHGAPGSGQFGTLIVALPSGTADGRFAAPVLTLFPNPSKGGQVTVQLDQKAGSSYKLRVSNIIGREIRVVALKPELSATGVALNLSDLPAGMYFYSLLVNDKVVSTKRLVLQN